MRAPMFNISWVEQQWRMFCDEDTVHEWEPNFPQRLTAIKGMHAGIPSCCVAHFTRVEFETPRKLIGYEQELRWRHQMSPAAQQIFDTRQYVLCDACCHMLVMGYEPAPMCPDTCFSCQTGGSSLACLVARYDHALHTGKHSTVDIHTLTEAYADMPGFASFIQALRRQHRLT